MENNSRYTCPTCNAGFEKAAKKKGVKGTYCPECDQRLNVKRVRKNDGGGFNTYYVPYNEAPQLPTMKVVTRQPDNKPNPIELIRNHPLTIKMDNEVLYIFYFKILLDDMVRCGNCNKAGFKHGSTLKGDVNWECTRCKTINKFIFLPDGHITEYEEVLPYLMTI